MVSQTTTALLFFHVIALHVAFLFSKVALNYVVYDCPHQCSCSTDNSMKSNITCSVSTLTDWELTCQQLAEYTTQSSVIDLKVLGNSSIISRELTCLPQLLSLDLSKTFLVVVEGMFHGLHVDSLLNISSNEITHLPADVFSRLEHLYELDLSYNFLTVLDPEIFRGLSSLKILHIGFNSLGVLPLDSFSYTSSLEYLGLEYNRIQEFSSLHIPHTASLKSLNLHSNILQTINTDIKGADLYVWKNISSLDISGNPLECSCALRNLYTIVPNLHQVLVNPSGTTCITPEKWKGRSILNVSKTELSCIAPNSIISFPSGHKDIVGTSSVTLQCQAKGYPKPSILWITPWKDRFFSGSQLLLHSQGLQPQADEKIYTYKEYKDHNVFMVSAVRLTLNNDLVVTQIRGSMSGNYTCLAFNVAGNTSVEISLLVFSAVKTVVLHSLFMGGYCALWVFCYLVLLLVLLR